MKPLIKEAVCISQDLGDVTFVGAVAVMLHTGEQRQSQDLDFVVAKQITVDEFLDKGYKIDLQGKKFTPRNYKVDVYHERNLNGIPLDYIIRTATAIPVDKKGTTVNTISLEGLIIAKYRAGRDQDIEDLQRLAVCCSHKINWDEVKCLAKSDTEYSEIEQAISLYLT
ncbi:MAG: nucleotidyltransferase [Thaumarchaeota archaeon]|nr:nucleotidyltransferase [Nitrososphaerota archaeon]